MQTFVLILGLLLPDGSREAKVFPHAYPDIGACIADGQTEKAANEAKVTWVCVGSQYLPGLPI
jgi:hypothetical protein